MVTNYRGQEITYSRLWEVLEDYLDGRRVYSISKRDGRLLCCYRLDETPNCPVACLVGSFLDDSQYRYTMEGYLIYGIEDALLINPQVALDDINFFQRIHDALAKKDYDSALTILTSNLAPNIVKDSARRAAVLDKIAALIKRA